MSGKSVLLVEDDFLNRRLTKKVLSENGYNVWESKNTKEALEILKTEPVSIAILDINLGEYEQNGISLGQKIQQKYSIPFIYLTAYENPEIIGDALSTSPYSYLTKPFKNSDLIASIEIAIRQSANVRRRKPAVMVKDGDYNVEMDVDKINYIVSEGNYLLFHTDKKIYRTRSTVKNILRELPEPNFVQTHRAYVVNKEKIEKFNKRVVHVGNSEIPISASYLENLRTLFDY